jgi:uncharacterized protein
MGVISHDDWSLDRRGQQAQARHKQKVKEAIQKNLRGVVSDEGLILSDGKNVIRVPVHALDEPHFYFNRENGQHTGQGEGEQGDVIGQADPNGQKGSGSGSGGQGAGDGPGERVYEAEVTVDEVEELLFSDLCLPNLAPKPSTKQLIEEYEWTDVRNKGIESNLDRKRTFFEALKRSKSAHQAFQIIPEDIRYKTWEEQVRPDVGAVIFAMMDVSGSMGEFEKYVARTFFFWMERFIRKQYPKVNLCYLVHHTEAYEVTGQEFYRIRESGGTRCSSVYELALKQIRDHYPAEEWNIYPVHVSDGDNFSEDNARTHELARELCGYASQFAYLEVNGSTFGMNTTLGHALEMLDYPNFRSFHVRSRESILDALHYFFRKENVS